VPKDFASYRIVKNQDDAVLAVKAGLADAAFVRTGILEALTAAGKIKKGDVVVVDPKSGYPQALSTALYPEWYLIQVNQADPNAAKIKAAALALTPASAPAKAAKIKGFDQPVDAGGTTQMMKAMKVPPFNK
jgi:ABC-type amino acid transport substrate-binding protein